MQPQEIVCTCSNMPIIITLAVRSLRKRINHNTYNIVGGEFQGLLCRVSFEPDCVCVGFQQQHDPKEP